LSWGADVTPTRWRFRAAQQLAGRRAAPHHLVPQTRALLPVALVRLGETERAEQALAGLDDQVHMRSVYAKLGAHRLAEAVAHARGLGLLAPSARSH
jgi:hypothetical protein